MMPPGYKKPEQQPKKNEPKSHGTERVVEGMTFRMKVANIPNLKDQVESDYKINSVESKVNKTALKVQDHLGTKKVLTTAQAAVVVTNFSDFEVTEPSELKETTAMRQTPSKPRENLRKSDNIYSQQKPSSKQSENKPRVQLENKPRIPINNKPLPIEKREQRPINKVEVPKEEYDFAAANARFEKERLHEQKVTPTNDSFFDALPVEQNNEPYLLLIRFDHKAHRNEEKQLNLETFGQTGVRNNRNRRGRGRGRGRGKPN